MYSAGRADFEGGNQYSGTIIGDITNVVTAERIPLVVLMILTAVLVTMFRNLTRVKLASNEATYDAYTPQQRAELAKSAAAFKVLEIFLLN